MISRREGKTEAMTEMSVKKNDREREKKKTVRTALSFAIAVVLLLAVLFISLNTGTLKVGIVELFRGLFVKYLRFLILDFHESLLPYWQERGFLFQAFYFRLCLKILWRIRE